MKLKLYDIGRADCVLLFDDQKHPSNQFMIDCGVKKKDTRNIVEINNDLSLKEKNSLMITHFHSDHYWGMEWIDPHQFDAIYLNHFLLCFMEEIKVHQLTEILQVYIIASPRTKLRKLLKFILNYLYLCALNLKPKKKIIFITQGDTISPNEDYDVLWPDIDCEEGFSNLINRVLKEVKSFLTENPESDVTYNYAQSVSEKLHLIYSQVIEIERTNSNENIIDMSEDIITLSHQINDLINSLDGKVKDFDIDIENMQGLSQKLGNYMNDLSIVVHNERGIYFGDVSAKIVRQLKNKYYTNYNVVKTPHHGSNSHFDLSIPHSNLFLSCSNCRTKDINKKNDYYSCFPNFQHIFSNGDAFVSRLLILNNYVTNVIRKI